MRFGKLEIDTGLVLFTIIVVFMILMINIASKVEIEQEKTRQLEIQQEMLIYQKLENVEE